MIDIDAGFVGDALLQRIDHHVLALRQIDGVVGGLALHG